MAKNLFFIVFMLVMLSFDLGAQQTVVEIEDLSKPVGLLGEVPVANLDKLLNARFEKTSVSVDSLVFYQDHPFLTGIFNAYKDHRPIVLSPDMIWLLISQGFARYVDTNKDALRKKLVNFDGQNVLTVTSNEIFLGNPKSNWESLFPQFEKQIRFYAGERFVNNLISDFSTTTLPARIASEITLMEGMKSYFVYQVMIIGCGIPRVTLEGTVKDWEKVLEKIRFIRKYDMDWWAIELEPVIQQIIAAKKGNADNAFWMNMIKVHTRKSYGTINTIDGWITKLFPFDKKGIKTGFKPISDIGALAPELVKVPFILKDGVTGKTYNMEFWAGFVGLKQDKNDFTLKPEIAWAVNMPVSMAVPTWKRSDALSIYNVTTIPDEVYISKHLRLLDISFKREILIPDKLAEIDIEVMRLKGKIDEKESSHIIKLFPKTKILINDKEVNDGNRPVN